MTGRWLADVNRGQSVPKRERPDRRCSPSGTGALVSRLDGRGCRTRVRATTARTRVTIGSLPQMAGRRSIWLLGNDTVDSGGRRRVRPARIAAEHGE
jgi:hypothetical protein